MSEPVTDSLSGLLAWQCGVLSRAQARGYGISDGTLAARVRAGRWRRVHTGIYSATTGTLTRAAREWAAVLYCGAGATLSHETAAVLYGMAIPADARVHITVPTQRRCRAPAGIVVHRSTRLATSRHPSLDPPRTRFDPTVVDLLDGAASADRALALVAQACQQRLSTAARLRTELGARPGVQWRRQVLQALDDVARGAHSLLELRYLRDVERRHGLPTGRRQRAARRGSRREWSDISYDEYATVVELDGRLGHDTVADAWRDMRRDNATVVAGEAALRYGWADVTGRTCAAAAEVASVLKSRGWTGDPQRCGNSCEL